MLRTDYIQRMIDQIARALVRILRQRKDSEFVQAQQSLDDTVRMLFGLGIDLMLSMDLDSLIGSLQEPEKILVLTRLLKIDAELALDAGDASRSQAAYRRGLELLAYLCDLGIEMDGEAKDFLTAAQQQVHLGLWPASLTPFLPKEP